MINKVKVDDMCYEIEPTEDDAFWDGINNCVEFETPFFSLQLKSGNRVLINLNNLKTLVAKR